jgi:hypothetical protein
MLINSLFLGTVIGGSIWAFEVFALTDSAKILLLGVMLIAVACWTRRFLKGKATRDSDVSASL